jgi:alkanesulfonate monooxygenase SsuD/methylene tetrahydromethanopterin reductase-like flavin-dependent oxidoreductase (luciferase family)
MSFADIFRGQRRLMQPPIEDIETYWTPTEKAQTEQMLDFSVIGSRETVRRRLQQIIERTQADELMIVSDMYDPQKRLRSLELTMDAAA